MSGSNVDARFYHKEGDEAENVSERKKITQSILLSHLK